MWLPKDERTVLKNYYRKICKVLSKVDSNPIGKQWYSKSELIEIFSGTNCKKIPKNAKTALLKEAGKNNKLYLIKMAALDAANAALVARNLIKITQHESNEDSIGVSLAIEGYDLGRKYDSFFIRTGLWFEEYKNHWFILILGFVAGILGALIVEWSQN